MEHSFTRVLAGHRLAGTIERGLIATLISVTIVVGATTAGEDGEVLLSMRAAGPGVATTQA